MLVLIKMGAEETVGEQKITDNLLELGAQLKAGQGLTLVASLLPGNPTNHNNILYADQCKKTMQGMMDRIGLRGFAKCIIFEESQMCACVSTLMQSAGIGGLKPNTVMIGWPTNWRDPAHRNNNEYWSFLDVIHRGAAENMCLIVPKGLSDFVDQETRLEGTIDIWWVLQDGGLLLLLSFLLKQHKVWEQCRMRLFAVAQQSDNSVKMKADLTKMLYDLRITASVNIVEFAEPEISPFVYERTLRMEERTKLIRELHLSPKVEKTLLVDEPARKINVEDKNTKKSRDSYSGESATQVKVGDNVNLLGELDKRKVKKMHTAVILNHKIREISDEAEIVILNLPRPPKTKVGLSNYLEYLDALTDKIERVLLVRGSGKEVITIY